MYFLFVNKTYSETTKEPYGFKMQIFKVLFSEVREPTDKFLCLCDLTWETKTTLQVSVGSPFSGLLIGRCIRWNYGGEKYCRTPSNSGLKLYLRNSSTNNFCAPKCSKNSLFHELLIFAHSCCLQINGTRKIMGSRYIAVIFWFPRDVNNLQIVKKKPTKSYKSYQQY